MGCLLAGAARCRVCTDEKCKTHRQFSHYEISPQEREQRRKLALAVRVQKESRSRILHAVRQNLPRALARADFEMVALDYFRRLGHENHHRLFQVYGWEEKKTQTSWGGSTVDHERLAKGQIHEMTASRTVLPRLQLGRDSVEGSESHANSGPIQDRCIEDHHQSQRKAIG